MQIDQGQAGLHEAPEPAGGQVFCGSAVMETNLPVGGAIEQGASEECLDLPRFPARQDFLGVERRVIHPAGFGMKEGQPAGQDHRGGQVLGSRPCPPRSQGIVLGAPDIRLGQFPSDAEFLEFREGPKISVFHPVGEQVFSVQRPAGEVPGITCIDGGEEGFGIGGSRHGEFADLIAAQWSDHRDQDRRCLIRVVIVVVLLSPTRCRLRAGSCRLQFRGANFHRFPVQASGRREVLVDQSFIGPAAPLGDPGRDDDAGTVMCGAQGTGEIRQGLFKGVKTAEAAFVDGIEEEGGLGRTLLPLAEPVQIIATEDGG